MSYIAHYLQKDPNKLNEPGLLTGNFSDTKMQKAFIEAIGQHRFFEREKSGEIPA